MFSEADHVELKRMSNRALHDSNMTRVARERDNSEGLLWQLRETEVRRMYLEHKCESLYEYCIKILRYSEGSAGRRVNAARLLVEVPELAAKVVDGSVNLSNMSMAHSFIKAEEKRTGKKLNRTEKQKVASKIEDVSQDQAQRSLRDMMPEAPVGKEKKVILAGGEVEWRIAADVELQQLYERAKELDSHLELNMPAQMKRVLNAYLDKHDPLRKKPKKTQQASSEPSPGANAATERDVSTADGSSTQSFAAAAKPCVKRQTYFSVATERALAERSGGQCEHVYPDGSRCTRRHHLQTDHIIPVWAGGTNDLSNLQRLCRPHNLAKGGTLPGQVRSPEVSYKLH